MDVEDTRPGSGLTGLGIRGRNEHAG